MPHSSRTSLFIAVAVASLGLATLQPPGQAPAAEGAETVRQWIDHVGATLSTIGTASPTLSQ